MISDELYVLDLIARGEVDRARVNLRSDSLVAAGLRRVLDLWDEVIEQECDKVRQEMEQEVEDVRNDASDRESELDDREEVLDDLKNELDGRERALNEWERRLASGHCPRCPREDCPGDLVVEGLK